MATDAPAADPSAALDRVRQGCIGALRSRGWAAAADDFLVLSRHLAALDLGAGALQALLEAREAEDPLRAADVLDSASAVDGDHDLVDREGRRRRSVVDPDREARAQAAALGERSTHRVLLGAAHAAVADLLTRDPALTLWVWDPDTDALAAWRASLEDPAATVRDLVGPRRPPTDSDVWIHPALAGRDRQEALRLRAVIRSETACAAGVPGTGVRALVLVGPRPFHVEAPLVETLRGIGVGVAIARVADAAGDDAVADAIARARPDLLVSINGASLARAPVVRAQVERLSLPTVLWFVDDPEPALQDAAADLARDHVLALSWEREAVARLRAMGFAGAAYLPHGTRWTTSPTPLPGVGDLLFVGTSYAGDDRRTLHAGAGPELPVAWRRAIEDFDRRPWSTLASMREHLAGDEPTKDLFRQVWAGDAIAARRRAAVARALVPLGLQIFGDPDGWSRLLGPDSPVHGDVDAASVFPRLVAGARLSVDCVHPQMPTAVTQRVFDVPACGGLVLADDRPDLREHFEVGTEVLAYSDPAEAAEMARWALAHPSARTRIAAAARRRVQGEHTLRHRARRLLRLAHAHFGERT